MPDPDPLILSLRVQKMSPAKRYLQPYQQMEIPSRKRSVCGMTLFLDSLVLPSLDILLKLALMPLSPLCTHAERGTSE